ncbi:MAG: hypothetical protein JWN76_3440 [Chitinophagaceae bacterium]|nr:hypothetical protein [Chitinophagaceae bacterium]
MPQNQQIKILIAPLDWGLGHTTRCIPLIRHFMDAGCQVSVAGNLNQEKILQKEFPGIHCFKLNGYNISYAKSKRWLPFKIALQLPKIITAIIAENKALEKIIRSQKFDLIISDNRYGFRSKKIHSIFITHQLNIRAPYLWVEKIMRRFNYFFIEKFNECWVPDMDGEINLGGILSHPKQLPKLPVSYIGLLSRFNKNDEKQDIIYDIIAVLSGPEPQRTILENKLIEIFSKTKEKILLVRGTNNAREIANANFPIRNYINTDELQQLINSAELIICRSGYSSMMDLAVLQKKALLVPTPGQTEQEYLAQKLFQQQWFCTCTQEENLELKIEEAANFNYCLPEINNDGVKSFIENFLKRFNQQA